MAVPAGHIALVAKIDLQNPDLTGSQRMGLAAFYLFMEIHHLNLQRYFIHNIMSLNAVYE